MSKCIRLEDLKWHSPEESIVKPLTEFYVTESDIADLPTIDIVRCKDCKYYLEEKTDKPYCYLDKRVNLKPTDYCSWGERIEENIMPKKDLWVIGVCNTDGDGIWMRPVYGSKDEVKQMVFDEAHSQNTEYSNSLEGVPEIIDDIEDHETYLFAGPWGSDFHIDIAATRIDIPEA